MGFRWKWILIKLILYWCQREKNFLGKLNLIEEDENDEGKNNSFQGHTAKTQTHTHQ